VRSPRKGVVRSKLVQEKRCGNEQLKIDSVSTIGNMNSQGRRWNSTVVVPADQDRIELVHTKTRQAALMMGACIWGSIWIAIKGEILSPGKNLEDLPTEININSKPKRPGKSQKRKKGKNGNTLGRGRSLDHV